MKKFLAVVVTVVFALSLVSLAVAAETKKGTVKAVDAKAGSITLTIDGKDSTFKAASGVDISKCKAGDAVEVSVEKDTITSLKGAAAKKKIEGC